MNKVNQEIKETLQKMEGEVDVLLGKPKRWLMQGWMSKPAWIRAAFWFVVGNFTCAIAFSYLG